jgi:putative hemolysin
VQQSPNLAIDLSLRLSQGALALASWPIREIAAIGASLVLSAFFSAAETALTALGEARSRQLAEQKKVGFGFIRTWLDRPEQVMTTLLLGNTLCNIGASAMATVIFERYFAHAVAIATGVMTLLILYLSEISPKTFAKTHPVWMARRILPLTAAFYWVLFPISYPLFWLTTRVNRLVALRRGVVAPPAVTSEDIDYVINLGTREGVLDKVKEELLNSVLEFGDIVVKEIMTPRTQMQALDRESTPTELLAELAKMHASRIPVYQGSADSVVGILYAKSLLADLQKGIDKFRLDKYMRPPFFVPEGMKISRLLKEFQRRRVQMAIVVDEFGGTSGLVTLEDVVEELVGEIQDELEPGEGPVKILAEGIVMADGATPLRDLAEVLKIEFPENGDYETLGGFLTAQTGRVPPMGAVLTYGGHSFIVRVRDERRVGKVEIRKLRPETTARRERTASPARPGL